MPLNLTTVSPNLLVCFIMPELWSAAMLIVSAFPELLELPCSGWTPKTDHCFVSVPVPLRTVF
jgi:hypothetical protein